MARLLDKFKNRNKKMVSYVFRLTRWDTGTGLSFKEEMPECYFPSYISILQSSYPDWEIEAVKI